MQTLTLQCQVPGSDCITAARVPATNASSIVQTAHTRLAAWRSGWRRGIVVSGVRRMNKVNTHQAQLVPGWVTTFGRVYCLGM